VKESIRSNSSETQSILETMTKRVNETLSSSTLSLRHEVSLKVDSLTHQLTQGLPLSLSLSLSLSLFVSLSLS
jgi:hypothetical protein